MSTLKSFEQMFGADKSSPMGRFSMRRLRVDMNELIRNSPDGVYVHLQADRIDRFHLLILGPENTPYQGGNFLFAVCVPEDYPFGVPRVHFMTTSNDTVRLNPNLYSCGRVCLSIINTFFGPAWSPVQTLETLFLSIRSLLSEQPITNEPGYEKADKSKSEFYSKYVLHESIRVAVCESLENKRNFPESFWPTMVENFYHNYDTLMHKCEEMSGMDGVPLKAEREIEFLLETPIQKFQFKELARRLDALYKQLLPEKPSSDSQQRKNSTANVSVV